MKATYTWEKGDWFYSELERMLGVMLSDSEAAVLLITKGLPTKKIPYVEIPSDAVLHEGHWAIQYEVKLIRDIKNGSLS